MQKKKLGFSLIELSVVIVIIGILVIGITKGSRLIASSRLTSAKNLTAKSPVNLNADNLAFWLDTTSDKSFDSSETVDQSLVTNWYDINPITQTPFNFSSSGGNRPTYYKTAINNLPALRFDGINDQMVRSNTLGSELSKDGSQISVFVVQRYISPLHDSDIIWWNNSGTNRLNFEFTNSLGGAYFDLGDCCAPTARINFSPTNYLDRSIIITGVRRPNGYGVFRVNGKEQLISSPAGTMTSTINMGIPNNIVIANGNNAERAYINEIIVFKIGLKDKEMEDIERYLSAKWNIPLKGL